MRILNQAFRNLIFFSVVLYYSCAGPETTHEDIKVKNVIFFIGDGMGLAQVHAAMTSNGGTLELERCKHIGIQKTSSASDYITDSGASGTAMATGFKTTNKFIGLAPDSSKVENLSELAMRKGLKVGIVSTSAITHATPASFMAHQDSRYKYEELAYDIVNSHVDVIIGGGQPHFIARADGLNLLDTLTKAGYKMLEQIPGTEEEVYTEKVAFIYEQEHLPRKMDGRGEYLLDATKFTLTQLNQTGSGFFTMIEASQIDWGGHANDLEYVITETLDLDQAIGYAFDFADANPGTLVIITGDHETGGLSITGGNTEAAQVTGQFSTKGHSAIMIPVYAYGAQAERFNGFYENTEIFFKIKQLLDL